MNFGREMAEFHVKIKQVHKTVVWEDLEGTIQSTVLYVCMYPYYGLFKQTLFIDLYQVRIYVFK